MEQSDHTTIAYRFSTPVMTYDLPNGAEINAALKPIIFAKRESENGLKRSNLGGWQSNDDMLEWGNPQISALINAAVDKMYDLVAPRDSSEDVEIVYAAEMWANINEFGDSNILHCHPGALFSGVYYIDIGDDGSGANIEGQLQIYDPRHPMNQMYAPNVSLRTAEGKPQANTYMIQPANGRMVLFPAWLMHSVRPYKGKSERISVAFNIFIADYIPSN